VTPLKYDKQLIPEADRFVDRIPGLGADGQIVWREPASNALVL
jgi:hypothetical protein